MNDSSEMTEGEKALKKKIEHNECLSFLFKALHVDELSENDQHFIVDYFYRSESLQKMATFAMSLDDIIREMEVNMPAIDNGVIWACCKEQRAYYMSKLRHERIHQLKLQTAKKGNVFHVPFDAYKKELGPIIICLEQTDEMMTYTVQFKSMVLPLIMEAYRQSRDLYIVPFSEQVKVHFRFENGRLNLSDFIDFITYYAGGDAAIIPALEFTYALLRENRQYHESEIIIFTNGMPNDGRGLIEKSMKKMIVDMKKTFHAEISVVVMDEQKFNDQYFWFANRAFFANDYFQ